MREAAAHAFFLGLDVDLWPDLHRNRIEAAKELDVVLTTYDGLGTSAYRQAGVRCVFLPNLCDPDIEHRYDVAKQWKSDIIFTGRVRHKNYPTEEWRAELVSRIAQRANCAVYGSCGRPFLGGLEYFYAISGARIGLSINAANDIRLYHSDRFTHYLACGTLVLAKRVPDSELLFEEGKHLRYFDTREEFVELVDWYLAHEEERARIADAGMRRAHAEFNCEKIAQYMLDVVKTGTYRAPWT
jgi:spore maturation protein CgeB